MFAVWDYSNVLEYLFENLEAFEETDNKQNADKQTFVSAHTLVKRILLTQTKNPEFTQKQIFRKLKKMNITVVYPGSFFYDSKQDILSMQDVLYSSIQFSYLNLYDNIFVKDTIKNQKNQKEYSKFLAQNEFFLNLLTQHLKESLSKNCNEYNIPQIESPSLPQFQMIFLNRTNSQTQIQDSPIILAFAETQQKIIWKQNKQKIYFYDRKLFAKKLNLEENRLQKIFFWGLLIYCSSKIFTSQSIIKKVINNNSNDIENGYNKELSKISTQLKQIFEYVNNKDKIEITQEVLDFFSELKIVNKMKIQKFFNFFTQCNLIYDPYIGSNRFYIVQENLDSRQLQQNNYLSQLGQFLKFNGFLPQNYSRLSFKYQKFFILIQNKFYFESNELNYLQNIGFKRIVKNILENLILLMCHSIPKKIIIKQYYGQQFYNRLKIKMVPCTNEFQIYQKKFELYESLKNFQQISKKMKKQNYHKQSSFLTKSELLNLSYLNFLQQMGFIDVQTHIVNPYGKFLIRIGQSGYFEFGFMVLEFIKNDFFSEKSFIKIQKFTNTKPDQIKKIYQRISDHNYFLYMGETFSEIILKLIELMPQIMMKNPTRCHQDIWNMIEQGSLKSNIKQQEFYRIAFYELFFNTMKYYEHNKDNIIKFDLCQFQIMSKMIKIRHNINFMTTIYILTNQDTFSNKVEDLSAQRIYSVVNFINCQYNALLKSIFLNLIHQQNMSFDEKTKQMLNNIPFGNYYQGAKASIIKKIFTFIHAYETIADIFPLAEAKIREIILNDLKQIQIDKCFFETLTDIMLVLVKSFEKSGMHKIHDQFYQKLQDNFRFLLKTKKILNAILILNQFNVQNTLQQFFIFFIKFSNVQIFLNQFYNNMQKQNTDLLSDNEDDNKGKGAGPFESDNEVLDQVEVLKDLLFECQTKMNTQKIKIFRQDFNIEQLISRIRYLEKRIPELQLEEKFENNELTSDQVQYNYNNKQNYVFTLHEKIQELNDQLEGNNFTEKAIQNQTLQFRFNILVDKYRRLKTIYLKNKQRRKELEVFKEDFDYVLPIAKKMRKMLKIYYEQGQIDQKLLVQLSLEEQDRLLDDDEEEQEEVQQEQQSDEDFDLYASILQKYEKSSRDHVLKALCQKHVLYKKLKASKSQNQEEMMETISQYEIKISNMITEHKKQIETIKTTYRKKIDKISQDFQLDLHAYQSQITDSQMQRNMAFKKLADENKRLQQENDYSSQLLGPKVKAYEKEIEKLNKKILKLSKKLGLTSSQRDALLNSSQMSSQAKNNKELMQLITQIKDSLDNDNKGIMDQLLEYHQIKNKVAVLEKENNDLKNDIQDYENDFDKVEQQNKEQIEQIAALEGKLKGFQASQSKSSTAEMAKRIDNLTTELENKNAEISILNGELKYLRSVNELRDKDDDFRNLLQNLEDLQRKLLQKNKMIKDLQNNQIEQEIEKIEEDELKNDAELDGLAKEKQVQDMKSSLDVLNNRNRELAQQNKRKQFEIESLNKQIEDLLKKIPELEQFLLDSEKKKRLQIFAKQDNKKSNKELMYQLAYLEQELKDKHKVLRDREIENKRLRLRLSGIERDKNRLMEELLQMQKFSDTVKKLQKTDGDYNSLKQHNLELQDQLEALRDIYQIAEQEKDQLNEQYNEHFRELEKKEEQIQELIEKLQEQTIQNYYKEMVAETNEDKIKELLDLNKKLKKELETQEKNSVNYQKLSQIEYQLEEQEIIREEQKRRFQQILDENTEVKKLLKEYSNTIDVQQKKIESFGNFEDNLNSLKSEIKLLQDRIDKQRKIIRSRDVQIIQLITDTNEKTDMITKLNEQIKMLKNEVNSQKLDIDFKDNQIHDLRHGQYKLDQYLQIELNRYRQKFQFQDNGEQEKLEIYKQLDKWQEDIKFYEDQKNNKVIKKSDMISKKVQNQLKEQELIIQQKTRLLEENKFKSENLSEKINDLVNKNQQLLEKVQTQTRRAQQLELQIIEIKSKKNQNDFVKEEVHQTILNLKKDNQKLQTQYDKNHEELQEMRIKLNDYKNQITRYQDQIGNQKAQIEYLKGEVKNMQKQNEQFQEEIIENSEDFIKRIQEIDEEKRQLEQDLQSKINIIENLREESLQQTQKIKELEVKDKIYEKEFEDQQAQIEFLNNNQTFTPMAQQKIQQEQKIEQLLVEKDNQIITLQNQIIQLKKNPNFLNDSNIDQSQFQDSAIYNNLQAQYESDQNKIKDLSNKNQTLSNQITQLKNVVKEYEQFIKNKDLQEELDQKNPDLENSAIVNQNEDLTHQNERLSNAKVKLQKAKFQLQEKLTEYKKRLKMQENKNDQFQKEIDELKDQIQVYKVSADSERIQQNSEQVQKLFEDREKYYQNQIEKKEYEIYKLQVIEEQANTQELRIVELENELDQTQSERQRISDQLQASLLKTDEAQKKFNQINKVFKQSKEEIEQKEQEIIELKKKINKIENDNQVTYYNIEQNEIKIKELLEKIKVRDETIKMQEEQLQEVDDNNDTIDGEQKSENELLDQIKEKDLRIVKLLTEIQKNQDTEIELKSLMQKNKQLKETISEFKNKLQINQNKIKELNEQILQNNDFLEEQRKEMELIKQKSEERKEKAQKLQEMKNELDEKNKTLQLSMQQLIDERNTLEKENENTQEQFELEFNQLKELMDEKYQEILIYKKKQDKRVLQLNRDVEVLNFANQRLRHQVEALLANEKQFVKKQLYQIQNIQRMKIIQQNYNQF